MSLFVCYSKCGTCRKAKKFLSENGITVEERDIRTQNPTRKELETWQKASGVPLKKFFNTSGGLYKEMHLKDKLPSMSDDEILDLLATDGMLVRRPVFVMKDRVLVGFKEEEYRKAVDEGAC